MFESVRVTQSYIALFMHNWELVATAHYMLARQLLWNVHIWVHTALSL